MWVGWDGLDRQVNQTLVDLPVWSVNLARALSWLGLAGVVVTGTVATAVALWRVGVAWLGGWLIAVVSAGWGATQLLKLTIRRPRPPTNGDVSFARGFSFPSGHASVGVYAFGALAVVLALTLSGRRRWWSAGLVGVVGVAIGGSRLVLGVHWLTDVVAGWALGLVVLSMGVVVLRGVVSSRR